MFSATLFPLLHCKRIIPPQSPTEVNPSSSFLLALPLSILHNPPFASAVEENHKAEQAQSRREGSARKQRASRQHVCALLIKPLNQGAVTSSVSQRREGKPWDRHLEYSTLSCHPLANKDPLNTHTHQSLSLLSSCCSHSCGGR